MLKLLSLTFLTAATFGNRTDEVRSEVSGATIPENVGIVGGKSTDISEVPYQVALYKDVNFSCGGSIVSPTMIVTAAHCVKNQRPSDINFRAGSSYYRRGGVKVSAKNIWVHPKYVSLAHDYDVAVVEIDRPLNYSKTIKSIKLATSEPSDGSQVTISGWGALEEYGDLPSALQSAVVPFVNRKTCASDYAQYLSITPRMICAGVEGKDSCQGDSGGPLNANGQLAGIVSFGIGCARKDLPGVYTNVADPEITAFIRKYAKI